MNEEQESQPVEEIGKKDNAFPITCPSCGKTHEWKVEEPEKPFFYNCPNCGTRTDFPPIKKRSAIDRLKPYLAKKHLSLIISIGGFLFAFLIFFAGGINYSGPIGKYGGTFLEHLQQQIGNGEKFNNFLIVTWLLVPLLGVITGFLGLGSLRSRTRIGKRTVNIYILVLAISSYLVLLGAMTTIYNMRLTRTGDFFNLPRTSNYSIRKPLPIHPYSSPWFSSLQ